MYFIVIVLYNYTLTISSLAVALSSH